MAITPGHADFVSALARGLDVIACFGEDAEALTLSEVAAKTQLTRGTARRFLLTLEALDYLSFDGKTFRLTPKTLRLGYAYLSSLPLWKAAQPIMKSVVDALDEACSLGVLDGHDVVYVARIPPKHLSFVPLNLGTRMPAHINAMGQVLLAEFSSTALDEYFKTATLKKVTRYTPTDEATIRRALGRVVRDGYSLSDQQLEMGLRSIAVPVRSRVGGVKMAVSVSAWTDRASKQDLTHRFLPILRRAAGELAIAL